MASDRAIRRAGRITWIATAVLVIAVAVLFAATLHLHVPGSWFDIVQVLAFTVVASTLGALIVSRQPRNLVGWLLSYCALVLVLIDALGYYAALAYLGGHPDLPAARFAAWFQNFGVALFFPIVLTLMILLFPDGRLPSRRWRPVVVGALAVNVIGLGAWALSKQALSLECCETSLGIPNPIGVVPEKVAGGVIALMFFVGLLIGLPLCLVGLVLKRRRADLETRLQIRWLATVVAFGGIGLVLGSVLQFLVPDRWSGAAQAIDNLVLFGIAVGVPVAMGVAVLRYRLYDLDLVIRRTVLFSIVAFTLTALYLAVLAVATVGAVSRVVVGVILLAVTFDPVRRAARSIADRVAYGKRASSYEVLSEFSGRMAETYATEDVPARLAAIVAGATGAVTARVWLRVGDTLRPEAESGEHGPVDARPIVADTLPEIAGQTAFEVRHQGDLLGALSVAMPSSDPLDPGRERLVRDLAAQAGLVLRNVRLIEELRASRQRLVAAQDEERHRLERNIHDGAQQQLVALAVKARLARTLGAKDPARSTEILEQMEAELSTALEDLRDLARGIYPPLLADKGLAVALEAQARRSAVPVTVVSDGVGRFPRSLEAAVYFSCLEALQNVTKYAGASTTTVVVSDGAGELRFEVTDDGVGFDPASTGYGTGLQGIRDRLDAVGGSLEVRSAPGEGTAVVGRIPAVGTDD